MVSEGEGVQNDTWVPKSGDGEHGIRKENRRVERVQFLTCSV